VNIDNQSHHSSLGRAARIVSGLVLAIGTLAALTKLAPRRQPISSSRRGTADGGAESAAETTVKLQIPEAVLREYRADQKKTSRRDRIRLFVEAAGLIAFIAAGVTAYRNLRVLTNQADIASRQLELTDRPWLTASLVVTAPFKTSDDKVNVFLGVATNFKNIGRSVARNVGVKVTAYPQRLMSDFIFTEPLKRQRELCADDARKLLNEGFLRLTLFPNEDGSLGTSIGFGREDLARTAAADMASAAKQGHSWPYPPFHPVIVGCVTYEFGSTARAHHTYFAYQVVKVNPERPGEMAAFNSDDLPGELRYIGLMKYPNAKTQDAD
jgi:hypothetical protein